MKMTFYLIIAFLILSCKDDQQKTVTQETSATKDTIAVGPPQQPSGQELTKDDLVPVADTGQTWFRVRITRNDSAFMDYEGSWPVFFLSGNSATLQLSKSKAIMSVTDIATFYMNGMPSGKVPIVMSNSERGTASMIFMPVNDGAYDLAISASEGFLNITKNVNEIVTGNFEAKAVDLDKNNYLFKGYFLNTKINPEKI